MEHEVAYFSVLTVVMRRDVDLGLKKKAVLFAAIHAHQNTCI
jgi:hypothetical protein